MKQELCKKCLNKGCGAYHDICPEYQEARAESINLNRVIKLKKMTNNALVKLRYNRYGRNFRQGQK